MGRHVVGALIAAESLGMSCRGGAPLLRVAPDAEQ
jgi:hypothetical protein